LLSAPVCAIVHVDSPPRFGEKLEKLEKPNAAVGPPHLA
jgi:hypothetical protein